jgi:hypothetical protein
MEHEGLVDARQAFYAARGTYKASPDRNLTGKTQLLHGVTARVLLGAVQTSPGPRCGVAAALSAPADVVIVPRSDVAVRWTVRETVTDCP